MPASVRPKVRKFDGPGGFKHKILQPSLTSYFLVHIIEPAGTWGAFKKANGINFSSGTQDQLNLLCTETVLPGSSLATHEIKNDYTGVTENHAYRRLFDQKIDLTFLVNADRDAYLPIRFFEGWIRYIADEKDEENKSVTNPNYSYRMNYPDQYYGGLEITKFERNHMMGGPQMTYHFVNAFPTSIISMPVSYDTSQTLKCTVTFNYIRYWNEKSAFQKSNTPPPPPATSRKTMFDASDSSDSSAWMNTPEGYKNFSNPQTSGSHRSPFDDPTAGLNDQNTQWNSSFELV